MPSTRSVTVYGASGHTGRFVVAELGRRGWLPVLAGRDAGKLEEVAARHPGLEVRVASTDDAASLDRAVDGAAAVVNCAGPFAFTAAPVIEAALRARVPYLDVAAEADVVAATIDRFDGPARAAGVVVAPALAFFGGLGDLLATAAMGDWDRADRIDLAYALSSWQPTRGTRETGEANDVRRRGGRLVFADGRLGLRSDEAAVGTWDFPPPIGRQEVVEEFTTADCVTLSHHLDVAEIRERMTRAPLADLAWTAQPAPPAVDGRGRSAQTFLVEAVVHRGRDERRTAARGQDIYAVSAPIVVEAMERLLAAPERSGVVPAGAVSDAADLLDALTPGHLVFER